MAKVAKYFTIEELVHPDILKKLSKDAAWRLVSQYVDQLDTLRTIFDGPLFINADGRSDCGLRPVDTKVGVPFSRHKGSDGIQAFDVHCADLPKLISIVKKFYKVLRISRIENPEKTNGWLHIEFSVDPVDKLVIFDP